MTVVEPIDLMNTIEIDYSATTSADAGLLEWDENKTDYTLEDEVKVASDKKKYKLAADTVEAGTIPKDNPTIWVSSPLSEYAMFDYENEYATSLSGNFVGNIPNAYGIDAVFFQGVDGDTITVTSYNTDDVEIDTNTEDIYDWDISSFGLYLFPKQAVKKEKITFDLFSLEQDKIKIEINGTNIDCSYCLAGPKDQLGITLRDGIGYSQNNFYTTSRDAWGNLISTKLRLIEDVSLPVVDYNQDANINSNKTARLFAKPALWIADDRDRSNVEFDFINIFGVLVTNSIVPGKDISEKTMKIEGK